MQMLIHDTHTKFKSWNGNGMINIPRWSDVDLTGKSVDEGHTSVLITDLNRVSLLESKDYISLENIEK